LGFSLDGLIATKVTCEQSAKNFVW